MAKIHVLSQDTINKIAAGEVIERPMAAAKELIENAIDAGADTIAVEIDNGGKSLVRITDNGSGMEAEDIELAFTPHATSKIKDVEDLLTVSSLGFRGEALSSIASVSQLEMITKTEEALMGTRYCIEGGKKKQIESIGCPAGTTFLVRNLFYNTPARLKFLKTAKTEAGYISGLVERMALSHPDISFRFLDQKQLKLSTSGNGSLKDVIYHIYGKDVAGNLIEIKQKEVFCRMEGFIGKPVLSRGNRAMMNYFINGRYVKSPVVQRAVIEAYAPYTMQHRYPFTALHITVDPESVDVNVHPQKMEIRFHNEKEIYQSIFHGISEALKYRELIPEITFREQPVKSDAGKEKRGLHVEPFEEKRNAVFYKNNAEAPKVKEYAEKEPSQAVLRERPDDYMKERKEVVRKTVDGTAEENLQETADRTAEKDLRETADRTAEKNLRETADDSLKSEPVKNAVQENLFEEGILSAKAEKEVKIIGQVFSTYWILQYEDAMYLVDQHAAHEKVLYERFMKEIANQKPMTQLLQPPVILSLSMIQQQALEEHKDIFAHLGYQIENFGGREYAVSGVPAHLPEVGSQDLLIEIIDSLLEERKQSKTPELLLDKIASMSCKAAVKGNNHLPLEQMQELLTELMTLENPYHCPHGRPTMIRMTKKELEKKFQRII